MGGDGILKVRKYYRSDRSKIGGKSKAKKYNEKKARQADEAV